MSADYDFPRLCGGVFFDLLLKAKRSHQKARDSFNGQSDGLSNVNILKALIRTFYPDYPDPYDRTFKTNTSEYKKCVTSSGAYLPFNNQTYIDRFNSEIHNNFDHVLDRFSSFAERFLTQDKRADQLIYSLIGLIAIDESIQDDEKFFVSYTGKPVTKEKLLKMEQISWPSFILGIWHYILVNRKDNTIGEATVKTIDNGTAAWEKPGFLEGITGPVNRVIINELAESWDEFDEDEVEDEESPREDIVGDYSEYMKKAIEKHGKIKTLLYNDEPRQFYDFYVCNRVFQFAQMRMDGEEHLMHRSIRNLDLKRLQHCSQYTILTGTGGLGKSMMMRHLLLSTIKEFDKYKRVPVFIPLKDFGRSSDNLDEMIFNIVYRLSSKVKKEAFYKDLRAGNFLLLFDGLDEVSIASRTDFESKLDAFTDAFSNNVFVLSSRPFNAFIYLNRFSVLQLRPFSRDQALELIDKLDFRPDEPKIKEKFRRELQERLYDSHNDFAQNPLLLTIMLMTYEQYAEVPSKMHIFYQEAYATLSQKHDASKGAYKRALRTGLTADRFAEYFAEFCAKTYINEKFELTREELENYYNGLKTKEKDNLPASASDFIYDLTSNMCLMYYEDSKFQFTHRSFQEYFAALCFSRWMDKNLYSIGKFFEDHRDRIVEDLTFNMLHDMIPEKVEAYIFLPFLQDLFDHCESDQGYWTFLSQIYPTIEYVASEPGERCHHYNESPSYIYNFITTDEGLNLGENISFLELPEYESLKVGELITFDLGEGRKGTIQRELNENISEEETFFNRIGAEFPPKHTAWVYSFKIDDVLKEREKYAKLLNALSAEEFPMKVEYYSMQRYMTKLKTQQDTSAEDLMDLF